MSVIVRTTLLLAASNIFMTFAWYAHLKNLNHQKWYIAAAVSWGIALFDICCKFRQTESVTLSLALLN